MDEDRPYNPSTFKLFAYRNCNNFCLFHTISMHRLYVVSLFIAHIMNLMDKQTFYFPRVLNKDTVTDQFSL